MSTSPKIHYSKLSSIRLIGKQQHIFLVLAAVKAVKQTASDPFPGTYNANPPSRRAAHCARTKLNHTCSFRAGWPGVIHVFCRGRAAVWFGVAASCHFFSARRHTKETIFDVAFHPKDPVSLWCFDCLS